MRVTAVDVTIVEIPQIEPIAPYRSHLRTSSTTRSAIVQVDTDEGIRGWGEHNVNFLPDVDQARLANAAREWLVGRDPLNVNAFHLHCPLDARLKSSLEMALWDIAGHAASQPVAMLLGGVIRHEIELAACMGIQSYERAGEIAAFYVQQGFSTLKTKAGSDIREDLEMVRGIRDAVGDRLKLRIDPNRAYSCQQAVQLARDLEPFSLEYLEQPIAAEPLSDATWLRQQTKVPIALNESVVDESSVLEILRHDAAAYLVPDTHIAGGMLPCANIGRIGAAAGIPCVMHCGHDLGPKTAAMLHLAASCAAYSLANDSTYYGLEDDVLTEPFTIEQGKIALPMRPGLGIDVDPDKLHHYRAKD